MVSLSLTPKYLHVAAFETPVLRQIIVKKT